MKFAAGVQTRFERNSNRLSILVPELVQCILLTTTEDLKEPRGSQQSSKDRAWERSSGGSSVDG